MKNVYFILSLIGLIVPYYFLLSFIAANGLNISLLLRQLFANDISTFFAIDLVISIIVFWIFTVNETRKLKMNNRWLYVLASLTVGLSFALPLFLYFREGQLENAK